MTDADEMRRAGFDVANSQGYGEALVELPTEESLMNDLRELGLVDEDV